MGGLIIFLSSLSQNDGISKIYQGDGGTKALFNSKLIQPDTDRARGLHRKGSSYGILKDNG
jgi:hypothetical protein